MTKVIATENAPQAIGPYSQGLVVGNMVMTSGQIPLNPKTGEMADTIEEQTKQTMLSLLQNALNTQKVEYCLK